MVALLTPLLFVPSPAPPYAPVAGPPTDDNGLRLPEGAVARLGTSRFATSAGEGGVAMSPDGKLVATGGAELRLWDANTGVSVRRVPMPEGVWAAPRAWSRDGRLVACLGHFGQFVVLDVASGKPQCAGEACKNDKTKYVTAVRFAADDRRLAFAFAPSAPDPSHGEYAYGADEAFGPPGWSVGLWDTKTGAGAQTRAAGDEARGGHLKALGAGYGFCYVALSPSGERAAWLASRPRGGDGKSAVFIFDTRTDKLLHAVTDLPRAYRVDLPDEGETLVLHPVRPATVDRVTVAKGVVVGVPDGRERFRFDYHFLPPTLVYSTDRDYGPVNIERSALRVRDSLLTFDGLGVRRWDWATGKPEDEFRARPHYLTTAVAAAADRGRVAFLHGRRLRVGDGSLSAFEKDQTFSYPPRVWFRADGRLVTSVDPAESRFDGRYQVWDAGGRQELERKALPRPEGFDAGDFLDPDPHTRPGEWVDPLSRDGRRVLSLTEDFTQVVAKWSDARTGRELGRHVFPVTPRMVLDGRAKPRWFARDGSVVGHVSAEWRLSLVNVDTGRAVQTDPVVRLSPEPDGAKVAGRPDNRAWNFTSAGHDRLVFAELSWSAPNTEYALWDRQGQLLRHFVIRQEAVASFERLSPDGRTLATYSGDLSGQDVQKDVALYETATGRLRGRLARVEDPGKAFVSLDFSPDGRLMATGSRDTTALLWDVGRPLGGKPERPAPETAADSEKLWDLLGNPDPRESDTALWALVRAPGRALALLDRRLVPVPVPDPARVRALIAELASEDFATRESASQALAAFGPPAVPAVRAAIAGSSDAEEARRLGELATRRPAFATGPHLRELRALEVLERIGTPEARKRVVVVAGGGAGTLLTREAQLVLGRWPERPMRP